MTFMIAMCLQYRNFRVRIRLFLSVPRPSQVQAEYSSYKMSGGGILETLVEFQSKFPTIVTNYDLGLLRYKAGVDRLGKRLR